MIKLLPSLLLLTISVLPLTAATLGGKALSEAESAMNNDNLARFMTGMIKTWEGPNWIYDDVGLSTDMSVTNNVAFDMGFLDEDWGKAGFMFGLTVYMLQFRKGFFQDSNGVTLSREDTSGLNFFTGIDYYSPDWTVYTGVNVSLTDHADLDGDLLTPYFFTNFSLFDHLIKPYLELAIPTNLSNLTSPFQRLALGAETPFGTPG